LAIDYSVSANRFTLLDAYPLPHIEDLVNRIARDKYFSSIDLQWASVVSPSASVSWRTALHRLWSWWPAFSVQTFAVWCYQRRLCLPTLHRRIHLKASPKESLRLPWRLGCYWQNSRSMVVIKNACLTPLLSAI